MMDAGLDMVVLDSRPMDEFHRMSIPTGVNVPGGELVYRFGALVQRPETVVVVNCAGRTRSILGAESLRSAGVPNRVVALRNGTMGWELAGFACDRGRTARYPEGIPAGAGEAFARADRFARRHGVRFATRAGYEEMRAETDRTTYLLDVRDPAEYAAGHLVGSRSAPGGQLVQATDQWVAVRGARIVLVDDTGVRARMAGGWLRQLGGWEVVVLTDGLDGRLEQGAWAPDVPRPRRAGAEDRPRRIAALLAEGGAPGHRPRPLRRFRDNHIPGAIWGIRTARRLEPS